MFLREPVNQNFIKRDNCRLCGSGNNQNVLPLTPTAFCEAYVTSERLCKEQEVFPLDLHMCLDCFYVHQPYVLSPEAKVHDYTGISTASLGLSGHFENYAEEVLNRLKVPNQALVVDIGSNDGTLLNFFRKKKMRVAGVDPALAFSREAQENGIKTFNEDFSPDLALRIKNNLGPASVVTINNLLANIDDLDELIKGVLLLMAEDGVFIIETSYLGNIVKNKIFDFIYHEHLSYFSIKPIKAFLLRFGMELIDIQEVSTKGGSLRYYAQRIGASMPIQPIVLDLIRKEEDGLDKVSTFKKLSDEITSIKQKVSNRLKDLKKEGKTIAGIGASATTTTLIYHFEIANMIDYLVDDNPIKQNTYSPGYYIPVVGSNIIYDKKPDFLVVFAWRFFDKILKKHKKYLDQGGQFIIPLPDYAEL